MKVLVLSICLVALVAFNWGVASAREQDICHLFSNNTVIRDPDSCSRSITCIDFKSSYSQCSGSTPFFDKDTKKCAKTLTNDTTCAVSCENAGSKFIADPKSCYGYYYCIDEQTPSPGICPPDTHFNETTQACLWRDDSVCKTTDFDYCSIIENGKNFDNLQGCDRYHVCTKGVLKDEKCKSGYYNAISGTCVDKALVPCDAHPLPTNVCGKASSPKKNVFVSDGATCRGYFFCAKKDNGKPDPNPVWNHCPADKFFDSSTQTCRDPLLVACSEDRCDGRTTTLVVSGKYGCRHYLQCVDGITVSERSCGNNFFNEKMGACGTEIMTYTACTSK